MKLISLSFSLACGIFHNAIINSCSLCLIIFQHATTGQKEKEDKVFFFQEGFDCWLLLPEVTSLSRTLRNILVVIRTHVKAHPEDGANTGESTYNPPKSFIVRHGRVGPEVLSLISCKELRSILLREP